MHRVGLAVACFCIVVFFSCAVNGQTALPPQTDTQEWNDVQVSIPLSKKVDFTWLGVLRFGRGVSRPVDERFGVAFSFKVGKYLTLTPNYLYIGMQPFRGRRVFEDRLSLAVTGRFPIGRFTLIDRNTFERRFRHPGGDSTRYRNRLQIEHPIGPKKLDLRVFANDEIFYDWSFNAWVRNRAAIGVSKTFNKHLTTDVYFMRQNDSHSFPGDLTIIGTSWRIKL